MESQASDFLVQTLAVALVVIGFLVTITGLLIRKMAIKVIDTVERVPTKEWFAKVEKLLDDIPSKEEWESHFARNFQLITDVNVLKAEMISTKHDIARHETWLQSIAGRRSSDVT